MNLAENLRVGLGTHGSNSLSLLALGLVGFVPRILYICGVIKKDLFWHCIRLETAANPGEHGTADRFVKRPSVRSVLENLFKFVDKTYLWFVTATVDV